MRLEQPSLLYDGGYWYVVPVVYDELEGHAPDVDITDWCAWYSDDMTVALVRTSYPVAGLNQAQKSPASIINTNMPRARIGGL